MQRGLSGRTISPDADVASHLRLLNPNGFSLLADGTTRVPPRPERNQLRREFGPSRRGKTGPAAIALGQVPDIAEA